VDGRGKHIKQYAFQKKSIYVDRALFCASCCEFACKILGVKEVTNNVCPSARYLIKERVFLVTKHEMLQLLTNLKFVYSVFNLLLI